MLCCVFSLSVFWRTGAGLWRDDWGWGLDGEMLEAREDLTRSLPALASLALGLL